MSGPASAPWPAPLPAPLPAPCPAECSMPQRLGPAAAGARVPRTGSSHLCRLMWVCSELGELCRPSRLCMMGSMGVGTGGLRGSPSPCLPSCSTDHRAERLAELPSCSSLCSLCSSTLQLVASGSGYLYGRVSVWGPSYPSKGGKTLV